ncbi:MAG: hypothetical protein JWM43_3065 [Acidobacteriaceae bacterium]|nr:hypothetical protein [Acidobacteriaceae bacterium]
MSLKSLSLSAMAVALLLSGRGVLAQSSSSRVDASAAAPFQASQPGPQYGGRLVTHDVRPFSAIGIELHAGLRGAGFDVATPLAKKFNLRAGADFLSVGTFFQEQGANVDADLRMRSGHAALDWFPFGGRFHLSPQVVFANDTQVQAKVLIPSGSTVTLNGEDYVSSAADPLHGSGSVDFRKVVPGFSLGFGNIVPRNKSHWSIPFEAGFYYVGQPRLKVAFSGSACDPRFPAAIGCQSVNNDPDFQRDLAAFIKRNNNNLKYASFLPVLSIGVGYKF